MTLDHQNRSRGLPGSLGLNATEDNMDAGHAVWFAAQRRQRQQDVWSGFIAGMLLTALVFAVIGIAQSCGGF
jgi:hypothetical protein